jgi:hypothetical protein
MTLGCGITAMRCIRQSQRGHAITSTENTFSKEIRPGTQRRATQRWGKDWPNERGWQDLLLRI